MTVEAIISVIVFVSGLLIGYGKLQGQTIRIDNLERQIASKADQIVMQNAINDLTIEIRLLREQIIDLIRDHRA